MHESVRPGARRSTHRLTRRRYALTAGRPAAHWLAGIAVACALAALGAAGFALNVAREQAGARAAECAPPLSGAELRDELARARLSLEQTSVERAALRKDAEASAAELQRLRTELAFFQRQRAVKAP